jgi:hypothetical protein
VFRPERQESLAELRACWRRKSSGYVKVCSFFEKAGSGLGDTANGDVALGCNRHRWSNFAFADH